MRQYSPRLLPGGVMHLLDDTEHKAIDDFIRDGRTITDVAAPSEAMVETIPPLIAYARFIRSRPGFTTPNENLLTSWCDGRFGCLSGTPPACHIAQLLDLEVLEPENRERRSPERTAKEEANPPVAVLLRIPFRLVAHAAVAGGGQEKAVTIWPRFLHEMTHLDNLINREGLFAINSVSSIPGLTRENWKTSIEPSRAHAAARRVGIPSFKS